MPGRVGRPRRARAGRVADWEEREEGREPPRASRRVSHLVLFGGAVGFNGSGTVYWVSGERTGLKLVSRSRSGRTR